MINRTAIQQWSEHAPCSFLILVDYTFVLNLDKVASVKHQN